MVYGIGDMVYGIDDVVYGIEHMVDGCFYELGFLLFGGFTAPLQGFGV